MSTDLFLGIDIGTQGAKAVLCDLSGRVMASGYREHTTTSPQPGWAEHDAELVWWGSFVSLAREIVVRADIRPSQIAGLAVSAFVPAMLPLDSEGRPLRPAILWTDRRAARELE
jgi:xylulokinase